MLPKPEDSPHELHLSLRALGSFARPFQLTGPRSTDSPPGSSPEVSRPYSASSKERLPTAGLPPPLRSAYAVSHDLDGLLRSMPPPGIAPGFTHGVPTLQGHSRLARKAPFPKLPAPHGFSKATLPRAGTQRAHVTLLNLQGINSTCRPYPSTSSFPSVGDRHPLGFSLVGPRFYRPSEGQAPRSLR